MIEVLPFSERPELLRPKIILITDPRYSLAHIEKTIEDTSYVLQRGELLVQLRDKSGPTEDSARALREKTRSLGQWFVINGDVALARSVGADGVHLPGVRPDVASARRALGDEAWISIAAHDDDDVAYAVTTRATAVLVSPIFESPGKGTPRGTAALASARAMVCARGEGATNRVLVYALGGIDANPDARRAAACAEIPVDGVAVIRALFDSADARVTSRLLAASFDQTK